MPLPHPHGNAAPGDLFYDTDGAKVNWVDMAGPFGSRVVEVGEDGLSIIANRMAVALGKNDAWLSAANESSLAKLDYVGFTPAGGNGGSFTFTGLNVWVGTSLYGAENQHVRNQIITVLDENYNEVLDTDGSRVVVKTIKDNGDVASVVGGGFEAAPLITFQTVHPVTGAVISASHDLPDGVPVVFAFGVAHLFEELSAPANRDKMRDMIAKGVIFNAARAPAHVFLTDGSRKLIGDLDLGAYGLQDDVATATVKLAETGYAALSGVFRQSLVGASNSNHRAIQGLQGNRMLGGTVTFTPGATSGDDATITLGSVEILHNGEYHAMPDGDTTLLVADFDKMIFVVVAAAGTVTIREANEVLATDTLLGHCFLDTGTNTFAGATGYGRALLWGEDKHNQCTEMTVGDAAGCDFPGTFEGITAAINLADAMSAAWANNSASPLNAEIQVKGMLKIASTVVLNFKSPSPPSLSFRGDGIQSSIIATDGLAVTDHLFDCNKHCVSFQDLSFYWAEANPQNDDRAALLNPGSYSSIRNVNFEKSGAGAGGFGYAALWAHGTPFTVEGITVEDIVMRYPSGGVLQGATETYVNDPEAGEFYVRDSSVRNAIVTNASGSSPGIMFNMPGTSNKLSNVKLSYGGAGIVIGHAGVVEDSYIEAGSGSPGTIGIRISLKGTTNRKASVRNCEVVDGTCGVLVYANNASCRSLWEVEGCTFDSCNYGVTADFSTGAGNAASSCAWVTNCDFTDCLVTDVDLNKQRKAFISGCNSSGCAGISVYGKDTRVHMSSCNIEDYGTGATDHAIHLDTGTKRSKVSECTLGANGSATSSMVLLASNFCAFNDNTLGDDSTNTSADMVVVAADFTKLKGNSFLKTAAGKNGVVLGNGATQLKAKVTDSEFWYIGGTAIYLDDISKVTISGNTVDTCRTGVAGVGALGEVRIAGNDFILCGFGTYLATTSAVIHLNSTASHVSIIERNTFKDCGDIANKDNLKYIIYTAKEAAVLNNQFYQPRGANLASKSDELYGVYTGGRAEVSDNYFVHDLTAMAPLKIFFIQVAAVDSIVENNDFDISASGAMGNAPAHTYGVHGGALSGLKISNNRVSYMDADDSGGAAYSFYATGDYLTAVGNTCGGTLFAHTSWPSHGIDFQGDKGMVMGNRCYSISTGLIFNMGSHWGPSKAGAALADLNKSGA